MSNKYILAIETSSSICGVAVMNNKEMLSIEEKDVRRKHAELLPDLTKSSLNNSKITLDDVDAIAISIGPGSFTGLRIGLGFSKGIAYAKNLPIIPVPSMLSLAYSLREYEPKQGILLSHASKVFFRLFVGRIIFLFQLKNLLWGKLMIIFKFYPTGFTITVKIYYRIKKQLRLAKHSSSNIGQLASIHFEDLVVNEPYSIVPSYIAPFKTGT